MFDRRPIAHVASLPGSRLLARGAQLLHVHSAVDVDLSARNVLALGHEEATDPRHFPRLAKTAQRDLGEQRLLNVLRKVDHHLRLDEAGTESIDRNVELRQLLRRRLRETDDPRSEEHTSELQSPYE